MLWICVKCTTAYSVGAPKCPQCGGKKYVDQGSPEHLRMLAVTAKLVSEPGPELIDLPPGSVVAAGDPRQETP